MNILSLVFTALLVLGLFANAQWNNFKHFTVVKKQYENYIEHSEREHFNKRQSLLFNSRNKTKKDSKTKPPPKKQSSSPKINIRLILEKKQREKNADRAAQHLYILKELIKVIYGETDDFKKIEEKRPDFLDDLFNRLIKISEKKTFVNFQALTTLDLQDEELQNIYYKVLNGIPKIAVGTKPAADDKNCPKTEGDGNAKISLKQFLHYKPGSMEISVYTASETLLTALFDSQTAKQIIEMREQLYKQVKNSGDDGAAAIATQKLSGFLSKKKPEIKDNTLNFTVTKTNPTGYK